jgi:hypothetical protein
MPEDVLADFLPLRQAAIIRRYALQYEGITGSGPHHYRSPAEIRTAVSAEIARRRIETELPPDERSHFCGRPRWTSGCPVRQWPPRAGSWRNKIFHQLVDTFGPLCSTCHLNEGCRIDHDHFTGDIRGLLCVNCNTRIDDCLHANSSECFAGEYLNQPPAFAMGLLYRPENTVKRFDRIRCHVLGFNIFDVNCWPSRNPAEWIWEPPPDESLRHLEQCKLREFRAEFANGRTVAPTQGNAQRIPREPKTVTALNGRDLSNDHQY